MKSPTRILAAVVAEPHRWLPDVKYRNEADFTLDRQIAAARREMGEARWNELQAEWNAK